MDQKREEEYMVDGNEAVSFKLVRSEEDIYDQSGYFKPEMCHQIFGEKEVVYGYKDLKIKILYAADLLRMYVGVDFSAKLPDVEPDDIFRKISLKYGCVTIFDSIDLFQKSLSASKTFLPYGKLLNEFSAPASGVERNDYSISRYQIYFCTAKTRDFDAYHYRLQTFLLWYIDAASFIDIDDPNWKFYVLYETYRHAGSSNKLQFALAGYISVYEYYGYPNLIRPRISQVLILPPFQKRGLCSKLLSTIYDHYATKTNILDFTVEDPTEDFQKIRDFVDCLRILRADEIVVEDENKPGETAMRPAYRKLVIERLHSVFKINKKQARRVYEILRLKDLNENNEEAFKEYEMEVKQRLNAPFLRQNKIKEKFGSRMTEAEIKEHFVDDDVRKEKIESMFEDLLNQYRSVLKRLSKELEKDD